MVQWMTTGEVARLLGYSIPWVRERINLGQLPARSHHGRVRRSLRVSNEDLEQFVERFLLPADWDTEMSAERDTLQLSSSLPQRQSVSLRS